MTEIVYLNGNLIPKNEAFIFPDDRGFNFADGIYEVIKYYKGKPFRLADHLERLRRSLREIRIDFNGADQFEAVFQSLLKMNDLTNQEAGIYLQISRGSHPRIHRFPENTKPTVYATAFPLSVPKQQLENGIKVVTAEDIRWLRCDIKSISLLPNVLAAQQAVENGAIETVYVRNGVVTEGSHSSVLTVKNGIVYTHPDSNLILPGITKKVVFEICQEKEVPVIEKAVKSSDLVNMDEMMIAGTGSEIMPVIKVNDFFIGTGKPGPVTHKIQEKFFELTR